MGNTCTSAAPRTVILPKQIILSTPTPSSDNNTNSLPNQFSPTNFKYNSCDLGIGEHYLYKEFELDNTVKAAAIRSKTLKWDKLILSMSKKSRLISEDSSLYNSTDVYLKQYGSSQTQSYAKMLKDGPPMKYRWSVWKNHLDMDKFYIKGLYEKFKDLSSVWEEQIKRDVSRSFPHEPYFASAKFGQIGQQQLYNVLKAISIYFPNIGYTQSMNFIVGFLLQVSGGNELEVFWMFVTLAREHKYFLMGLFEKNLPLLDVCIYVFYELLEIEMPEVYLHIKQEQLPDQLWLLKWFMTIFIYSLPPKQVVRVWDYVLEDGLFGVVKVAIGIVKLIEKDLLTVDVFGVDQLFRHLNPANKNNKSFSRHQRSDYENEARQVPNSGARDTPGEKDHHPERMVTIQNEISELHFSFEELDIEKAIAYARKISLSFPRITEMLSFYSKELDKPLSEPYQKFLEEWEHMQEPRKLEMFQRDLDYHIMKSELSETIFDDIRISNLLENDDNDCVLKDLV